ncbi:DUF397 domain-containing protein [Streptomyces wuyuanensis]|uniref:DUF397 domain-containing protein n=1 Tax=Streptomyces wuyuanensis TaxID=1196353 RepID=UPI00342F6B14
MSDILTWFKSSYSDSEGGDCVEVALDRRRSSHSDGRGGDCVEVALDRRRSSHSDGRGGDCVEMAACPHSLHVRDSELGEDGPRFAVAGAAWTPFLGGVPA